jgi:predicted anti-sigma-YlaC factor YlaD
MKCELIRELVFSDYTDGELGGRFRSEIDEHVRSCASCAELVKRVREEAVEPVRSAPKAEVPPYLWARIRERIASEVEERSNAGGLAGWALRALSGIPKPVVAFAAAAAVIIATVIARPIVQTRAANEYIAEEVEFIASLGAADAVAGDYFNTDIRSAADNLI